jgi:hypothetical protein
MRSDTPHIGPCPDDELLAALIDDSLAETERARAERHVARCDVCLDVVAAASSVAAAPAAVASTPEENVSARRSRARSGWRRFAIAASVLVVLGLTVGMLASTFAAHIVGPQLAKIGSRVFGVPLHLGRASVHLGAAPGQLVLSLREVSIGRMGKLSATVEELAVTVALAAPLSGGAPITRVRVTRPDLDLSAYGPTALVGSHAGRARILATLGTDRIEVEGGRIVVPGVNGQPLVLSDVSGGAVREGDVLRLVLQGRAAEGTVDVTGHVGLDAHELVLTIGGRDLQASAIPPFGEGLRGTMDVRLDLHGVGDTLRADGRVSVRDGALLDQAPATILGLGAEVRAVLAALDPALGGDDLAFEEARAVLAWRQGAWRLPRVFVTAGGIVAGGRARIGADHAVTGRGTVRLPADLTASLEPHVQALGPFRDASGAATLPFGVTGDLAAPSVTLGRR